MLKIEQLSKEIRVTFFKKDTLFTSDFLKAFAWAGGVHFVAFLLFSVQVYQWLEDKPQLPSVTLIPSQIDGKVSSYQSQEPLALQPPPLANFHSLPIDPLIVYAKSFHDPYPITLPPETKHAPFTLKLTGALNKYTPTLTPSQLKGPALARFKVIAKDNEIVWYDQTLSTGSKELDKEAEKLIRNMTLEPEAYWVKGEIEIQFEGDYD